MSARRRYISDRRANNAHRDLSSVTLVERGPAEGEYATRYHSYLKRWIGEYRLNGSVYSAVRLTEAEAREGARANALEAEAKKAAEAQGFYC